jgi:predicted PurR-regulated permease PerM
VSKEDRKAMSERPQPGFPVPLAAPARPFPTTDSAPGGQTRFFERTISLVAVALLTFACFQIVAPFIIPMLWGAIIAVSTWPLYKRLNRLLGNRPATTATLMTLLMFVVLVAPVAFLVGSLADSVVALGAAARGLTQAGLERPPAWLSELPAVGSLIDGLWQQAASNMSTVLAQIRPALGVVTGWLLQRLGDLGIAVLQFLVAVVIAGVMYVTGKPGLEVLRKLVRRIGGDQQVALVGLAGRTIRASPRA